MTALRTARLLLREWRDDDLEPFARLNADPEVMRHFPAPLDRTASNAFATRVRQRMAADGWGLWAVEAPAGIEVRDAAEVPGRAARQRHVEAPGGGRFIGFVGLARPPFESHFTPNVELGWRLARGAWGRGYATEAAAAALRHGFEQLGLGEIVSFTTTANLASQRVMQKVGMTRDATGDFDHPALPAGHPIRRHVLYRLRRDDWRAAQAD